MFVCLLFVCLNKVWNKPPVEENFEKGLVKEVFVNILFKCRCRNSCPEFTLFWC